MANTERLPQQIKMIGGKAQNPSSGYSRGGEKGNPVYLVSRLRGVDKPIARNLKSVGKLNGFHHALSTLDCRKFYFVAGQAHTWNGHSGLEAEVNGWPSRHLERDRKLWLPCGLELGTAAAAATQYLRLEI